MIIQTTLGERDESTLIKTQGVVDNDVEFTQIVEYCPIGCPGEPHRTGVPNGVGSFCSLHIHRSVNMHLKTGVFADSAIGGF